MRLLAVDDDVSILELLSEILRSFGYSDVVTACSGKDALQIISEAEQPFDCLLLDIQMPQMNGITLCEKVRETAGYEHVPIIMLTAMVQKIYIDDAFQAGATDYVTKPFDFADLRKRLADAQRLAAEREASIAAILEMESDSDAALSPPGFSITEPLPIDGPSGCVGSAEFENYVLQMSKSSLFNSSVVAVKIAHVEKLFAASSSELFRQIISLAARSISDCIQSSGNLISYRGGGVFLVIRHGNGLVDSADFEKSLNRRFSANKPENLMNLNLAFEVGENIHLGSASRSSAIHSLNIAVDSVERKSAEAGDLAALQKAPAPAKKGSPAAEKPEKRGFRVQFMDAFKNDRRKASTANDNLRDQDLQDPQPERERTSSAPKNSR